MSLIMAKNIRNKDNANFNINIFCKVIVNNSNYKIKYIEDKYLNRKHARALIIYYRVTDC